MDPNYMTGVAKVKFTYMLLSVLLILFSRARKIPNAIMLGGGAPDNSKYMMS